MPIYPSNLKISPNSRYLYVSDQGSSICGIYELGTFLSLGDDMNLCEGDTANIVPDDYYESYHWSDSSNDSSIAVLSNSNITLEVIDKFGKAGKDTINITFHEIPQIDIGNDTIIFYGDTLKLSIDPKLDGIWSTGETTNQIFFIADSMDYDTIISINAFSEFGCSSWDTIEISIQSPLSISNNKVSDLDIYPNPFNDELNIKGNELENFETIEIIDISGKVIYEKNINQNSSYINIRTSNIDKGIYIIKLHNNKEYMIRKLIKAH